jgi:alginate O-acetyltransferase complex protein AlgI
VGRVGWGILRAKIQRLLSSLSAPDSLVAGPIFCYSPMTMLFCTIQYVVFLTVIFAVYWSLPWARARVWLLLGASFYFYATWNKWLALLIGVTTVLDFLIALRMEAIASARGRKLLLLVSLTVNLGLLVVMKYANFFLDSLAQGLSAVGASASLPVLSVVLPVGISFYTFEAINYTMDVYRRRMKAESDLGHFMLFILFFPHLVAGPIVRARDFLPQVRKPKIWSWPRAWLGLWLIIQGTFKKLAIADRMALYADPVFSDPGSYSTGAVWLAVLAFVMQIYCDFSGYTDMALASAHLFGYKLTINFRMPFLAKNIGEFWRRWHISLSTWLRDYLFIPLGGSRGSRWKTNRNLFIVMTLGGLWHGAAWTYVFWGALQGILLIVHRIFADWCRGRPRYDRLLQTWPGTIGRVGFTLLTVTLCCAIFRASSLSDGWVIIRRLFTDAPGMPLPLYSFGIWATVAVMVVGHALGVILQKYRMTVWRWGLRVSAPVAGFGMAAVFNLALLLAPGVSKAFIYFQF